MRCLSCQYELRGLTEHRCPECGRAFDPTDPSTFIVHARHQSRRGLQVLILFSVVWLILFGLALRREITRPPGQVVNNVPGVVATLVQPSMPKMIFVAFVVSLPQTAMMILFGLIAYFFLGWAFNAIALRVRWARTPSATHRRKA